MLDRSSSSLEEDVTLTHQNVFNSVILLILKNKHWCSCRTVFAHVGCSKWLSEVYNVNDMFKSGRWMCSYFVFWQPGSLSQNQKWEIICLRGSHTKEKCQQIHVRTEKIAFRTYAVCGTSLSLEAGGEGRGVVGLGGWECTPWPHCGSW